MVALDLFRSSLRLIGALRPGQSIASSSAWGVDVLFVVNAMLDAWMIDRFMIYSIERDVYQLVPNQVSYKIGPGAPDFNAPRPERIEDAGIINVATSPYVETPIAILTDQQWAYEPYKAATPPYTTTIPSRMYCDRNNPISTITLLPICSVNNQLVLYVWKVLAQFVALTDTVVFPPGYADAIRYNLAVRLALEWGKEPSEWLIMQAAASKSDVASLNAPNRAMRVDPAIRRMGRRGYFDPYVNEYR